MEEKDVRKAFWERAQEAIDRHVEQYEEQRMERSMHKQVLELAEEGMAVQEIAEKMQVDREIVVEVLKEAGLQCDSLSV